MTVDGEAEGGRHRLNERCFLVLVAGGSGWNWLLDKE
jgi:hypothetical protein